MTGDELGERIRKRAQLVQRAAVQVAREDVVRQMRVTRTVGAVVTTRTARARAARVRPAAIAPWAAVITPVARLAGRPATAARLVAIGLRRPLARPTGTGLAGRTATGARLLTRLAGASRRTRAIGRARRAIAIRLRRTLTGLTSGTATAAGLVTRLAGAGLAVTRGRTRAAGLAAALGSRLSTAGPAATRSATARAAAARLATSRLAIAGLAATGLAAGGATSVLCHRASSRSRALSCTRSLGSQTSPEKREGHRECGGLLESMSGGVLLSHAVTRAVPSALKGLASGFGMDPGVSPSTWPPKLY